MRRVVRAGREPRRGAREHEVVVDGLLLAHTDAEGLALAVEPDGTGLRRAGGTGIEPIRHSHVTQVSSGPE